MFKKSISILLAIITIFSLVNIVNATGETSFSLERIGVTCEEFLCECKQYGIITAHRNNEVVWEYTTETVPLTELEPISDVYVDNGTAYIAVGSNLYALNVQDGTVKWTANEVGASNSCVFDAYGNIYISGYYGPNLMVLDKNGNVLYKDNDPSYSWVYMLEIKDNMMYIHYDSWDADNQVKILNISQFYPDEISVLVNGTKINFDQPPIIVSDRTLVPLRAIFEALGATVNWDGDTQTVTAEREGKKISLSIGSNQLDINGETKTIDVPAQLVNDRTLVPVRAISEAFLCSVDWDGNSQTVIITN